jgi:hypothetical protein
MCQWVAVIHVPSKINETNKRHMQILYLEVGIWIGLIFYFFSWNSQVYTPWVQIPCFWDIPPTHSDGLSTKLWLLMELSTSGRVNLTYNGPWRVLQIVSACSLMVFPFLSFLLWQHQIVPCPLDFRVTISSRLFTFNLVPKHLEKLWLVMYYHPRGRILNELLEESWLGVCKLDLESRSVLNFGPADEERVVQMESKFEMFWRARVKNCN